MTVQVLAGYWDLDMATGELILCPRSRAMFGVSGTTSRKLGSLDWRSRIHPDDMPVISHEFDSASRRNGIYSARFRAVRPDGSTREIVGVGRSTARDPQRFVGLNFDLATTTESALAHLRRPVGLIARLAPLLSARSRAANENQLWSSRGLLPRYGDPERSDCTAERLLLKNRALAMIHTRRLRHDFLGCETLGEPGFDILLSLYVRDSCASVGLRDLSASIGVTEHCARRWLDCLVLNGLALGETCGAGELHAALTAKGRTALDGYFRASATYRRRPR